MIYSLNNVMEAYVGSNIKELKEIENAVASIIKKVRKNQIDVNFLDYLKSKDRTFAEDILISKENEIIEKQFKKLFGFKNMNVIWSSEPMVSFSTIPDPLPFFKKSTVHSNGIDEFNINCFIFMDFYLIKHTTLTEREIVAFMLHEIGHSFVCVGLQLMASIPIFVYSIPTAIPHFLLTITPITKMAHIILSSQNLKKISINTIRSIKEIKGLKDIVNTYSYCNEILSVYIHFRTLLTSFLPVKINYSLLNEIKDFIIGTNPIFGYSREKISDQFATKYGYGQDLITGLHKIDNLEYNRFTPDINTFAPIGMLRDFTNMTDLVIRDLIAPHGGNHRRILNVIEKLERDIETETVISKSMKSDMISQIQYLKDFYEKEYKTLNPTTENGKIKYNLFTNMYITILHMIFKKDPRDFIASVQKI